VGDGVDAAIGLTVLAWVSPLLGLQATVKAALAVAIKAACSSFLRQILERDDEPGFFSCGIMFSICYFEQYLF
jgi:hypothetical protein